MDILLKGPFHVIFMGYDGTKSYLKQHLQFEEIGDWYKKEEFEEAKKLTGLVPDDENVYVVSVSS